MKSGLDDKGALKATVRQVLSAYLVEQEESAVAAELLLTTAKKRGLSLVGAAYNILKRTFSESADGKYQNELFYSRLSAFIDKYM